jgi:selenocysteine lyase/cysteine desulfurase
MSTTRREFARLLTTSTVAAAAAPFWGRALDAEALDRAGLTLEPLPQTPAAPDEAFWHSVRARFLLPRDLAFLNAANLCPASLAAVESHERHLRRYEADPSPDFRAGLLAAREEIRKLVAGDLRVTPDEIVLTRNTTEANNFVSSGLDLGPGDEVVVWADNHQSNLNAWRAKAQRFGYAVVTVPTPAAHPGTDGYVDLFLKAFTPRTRVVAFTFVSSNSGDLLPVAEICAAARARGVLSLVDSAQAFGVLDVDLSVLKPDFFTGSMHKWPCGPKEKGILFAARAVHDRLHPSVVGVYGGQVGLSRTFEACGQRDDASMAATVEAWKFRRMIGLKTIEARSRQLAQALMHGLRALPGVKLWTDPLPDRSAAIVIFQPGTADPRRVGAALVDKHRIITTVRAGQQNPGLRISPHFYNTMDEIDRTVAAVKGLL